MTKVKLFDSLDEGLKIIPEGEKRKVRIGQTDLCVLNRKGRLIAFHNACPHMGHPLHEGNVNPQGEIVCPWHYYRYDLETGEESNFKCDPLRFYAIGTDESGNVVIDF